MPSLQSHVIKTIFRFRRLINPPTGLLDVEKSRAETESLAAFFKTKVAYSSTPVDIDGLPGEWVAPTGLPEDRAVLYFHGGSYNAGSINSHRSLVADIGYAAKTRVLILDYRLAPEHPYPAAVEDALLAYQYLLDNHFDPGKIILAGDSCGGGLTLALLIALRDEREPLPAGAVCLSPWTDLTCAGESWSTNRKKDLMLDPGAIKESARLYLGEVDPKTPLASPLFANLDGLPPLLIQVGSDECILSDSLLFAEAGEAAGVEVTLEVWPGMQHEWHFAAEMLPEGRQAVDRIGEFILELVGKA
jgi:acetyl esterase/lipase